jgi:hypothetical protein
MLGKRRMRLVDFDTAVVSGADLAEFFIRSPARIRQLVKCGMPRLARDLYPLGQCIRWYVTYRRRGGRERRRSKHKERLLGARLKLIELKLQRDTGVFINDELIYARRYMIRSLNRELRPLAFQLGRQNGWSKEIVRAVSDGLNTARLNIIGQNEWFLNRRYETAKCDYFNYYYPDRNLP